MSNDQFFKNSFLFGTNAAYLEELYAQYLQDKNSVSKEWQEVFKNFNEQNSQEAIKSIQTHYNFHNVTKQKSSSEVRSSSPTSGSCLPLQVKMLASAYRNQGHFLAKLDPLELEKLATEQDLKLDIASFGIREQDLDTVVELDGKNATVREHITRLKEVYSNNVGYEFSHINNFEQVQWLINRIENYQPQTELSAEDRKSILKSLIEVESFEQFLQTKFPSAKRFSVEGGENTVIATEWIIKTAAQNDVKEAVLGMAHRGRLNTLTKILKKPYVAMFAEFQGGMAFPKETGMLGDVKYHVGCSTDMVINGKKIHLSMAANPSHLEAINPVVAGKVRAKQDLLKDTQRHDVMGVLLHGDASFTGQGVVMESLMLSDLEGYKVGGIVHIIVNNQVGFTATARNARVSRYPTEVAKIIEAPIFHVNGNKAEEVVKVSKIATEYRNKFGKDVVLNVMCYRLYGHNEMDEPKFTQPTMYKKIESLATPAKLYADQLLANKVIDEGFYDNYKDDFKSKLEQDLTLSKTFKPEKADWFEGIWSKFSNYKFGKSIDDSTGVKIATLREIGLKLSETPQSVVVNARIKRQLEARKQIMETGQGINWATAEGLAFGSLLIDKINIRLSGQDSGRGTFSQRHSVLIDQESDTTYIPLNNLSKDQGSYEVIDSSLSEYAVMGFEYGYSTVDPARLVLWEAQYGDFANGAQIIIDQFVSSAEVKWLRSSGLVLLLPHAYEGEGPEHSSARLERFLQLCAEDNMQVVNCSTPASYFHVLRRQIYRDYRKPLIIMTPKSLLRHKLALSSLAEFDEGTKFQPVIPETMKISEAKRVVLCSGKVYYDLLEYRENNKINNVAIIRLEQFYPWPKEELQFILQKYKNAEIIWCQEEPENMGAWRFIQPLIDNLMIELKINRKIKYAGRGAYASTSEGYSSTHRSGQEILIKEAINS
jgi:2-oxoglutarate dehydrogenase E1 component